MVRRYASKRKRLTKTYTTPRRAIIKLENQEGES
jgi:hypothetical protein